jgi:hypothetical protein
MISKAKLALIAAVAAVSVVSPALAQAGVHHARRNALHAYAMEPQHARRTTLDPYAMEPRAQSDFDSDSPAATGGGSVGYNELLKEEP